jgi:hypothetical protein
VLARLGQRLRVGDGPALEEQVSGFLFEEQGGAVLAVRVRVDRKEA